ncbi:hypothetical protein [uncultured Dialister sp.]|uniref:hypothetical protein n=1 Tax=uncultured Dialister sp. TaxID=278064 RepID=UPI0026DC89DA|nr:hypothetical protein [uncultured Dialister sp.]
MPNEFGVCMVYGRFCTWGAMVSLQILISTIIRKMGKDRKRLTHGRLPSILAFPVAILEIHGELLSILQVFHIPLLYKSKKSRFCERLFQKFYEILIFSVSQGSAQHHSGLAAKGKRLYFLVSLEVARELDS